MRTIVGEKLVDYLFREANQPSEPDDVIVALSPGVRTSSHEALHIGVGMSLDSIII